MNWLRTSLPRVAEVVASVRVFLEELMVGVARRTKYEVRGQKPGYSARIMDEGQEAGVGGSDGFGGSCRDAVPSPPRLPGADVSRCLRVSLG